MIPVVKELLDSEKAGFLIDAQRSGGSGSCLFTAIMVWPLTLRRTVLLKKTIRAPAETVLTLLHDHNVLFSLNPLVTKVTPDPDSSNSYTFTDTLSFAGLFTYEVTSKCLFDSRENGVDSTVVAGFGTHVKVCYRVKRLQAEETEVSDESTVEVSHSFADFIHDK